MSYIYFFVAATLISFLLTPLAIRLAYRIGAIDSPGERKVHEVPTPRFGGLAICATTILCLGAAFAMRPELWGSGPWASVLVGALIVYLLGLTDDLGGLNALTKLAVQVLAAFVAVSAGLRIDGVTLPYFGAVEFGGLATPITIVWIAGVTNAFNLIDGLDGLAGGLGLITALALFSLGSGDAGSLLFAAVLAGSLAGFLRYNYNPARVFMGDSGSLFTGYLLACLAVRSSWGEHSVGFAAPLLAMAIPVLDTATAMLRRYFGAVWNGGQIHARAFLRPTVMFHPDRGHIHHRLLDSGLTQRQAVGVLYALALALAALAIYAAGSPPVEAWYTAVGGALLFFLVRMISTTAAHK